MSFDLEGLPLELPANDYVSPGLKIVIPDAAFPNMIVGDTSVPKWPWLRRWVEHNWYTDRRNPNAGFISRDEAAILYNSALLVPDKPCLEIGCWRGWSAVHLALGTNSLDIIDPVFSKPDFAESIRASCRAANVIDKVTFHEGYSPGAIDALAQESGKRWSLIFIDGEHEGDGPRRDAEAAMRHADETALVLFHDLASPYVAAGLDAMRNAGWQTMIYQTMQIMGVAWRGNIEPVEHIPDPRVFWTLPQHLSGYHVCGWKRPKLPVTGAWWPNMTLEDRRRAAMMRAQAAEDDRTSSLLERDAAFAGREAALLERNAMLAERDAALVERDAAFAGREAALLERNAMLAERETALVERDAAFAGREVALLERNAMLAERDAALVERDAAFAGREVALLERNTMLAERDAALVERDAVLAERNVAVLKRDTALTELAQRTAGLEARRHAEMLALELKNKNLCAERDEFREVLSRQNLNSAIIALCRWFVTKHILIALLRQPGSVRGMALRKHAELLAIPELMSDTVAHLLCRRRMLLGLLWRSTQAGEAIIVPLLQQAAQISNNPHAGVAVQILPAHAGGVAQLLPRSDETAFGYTLPWRWRAGVAWNDSPPDPQLERYFQQLDVNGAAAANWAKHVASCWPVPEVREGLEETVTRIRNDGLFDSRYYSDRAGITGQNFDPALHYALVGEALGVSPSASFDPIYYADRNPDVLRAGLNLLLHYSYSGRSEGRLALPPSVWYQNRKQFNPDRENVIVVVHDASRTGAPILGWNIIKHLAATYNVFTVILNGGALVDEFRVLSAETFGPYPREHRTEIDLEFVLNPLFQNRIFRYAIINSSESRQIIEICSLHLVPTLFLMHEFGSCVGPATDLCRAFDLATEIVFPARIVAGSSEDLYPPLRHRNLKILPQGMSVLPAANAPSTPPPAVKLDELSKLRASGAFIVLGAGTVDFRKGVDLFLAAASAVLRTHRSLRRPVHFVWVGHGYNPTLDMGFSVFLREQIWRSSLEGNVTFLNEVSDLEPIYALADVFFLASRLDPLPNVSIDAAHRGIPIVCFESASGTSELLKANPGTALGVVSYLDANAAGQVIAQLASDNTMHKALGEATAALARRTFNMEHYVNQLDELGRNCAVRISQRQRDAESLTRSDGFDVDLFLGTKPIIEAREKTIARYLAFSAGVGVTGPESIGRRASPGFDPGKWERGHPGGLSSGEDAYAAFIRSGSPPGPWQSRVLHPPSKPSMFFGGDLRVVLHIHLPDDSSVDRLLTRLSSNTLACDLLVTTGSENNAKHISRALKTYNLGSLDVRVLPGNSTSILHSLAEELTHYDVIGHVYAYASNGQPARQDFQWETLLGGRHPMRDLTIDAFAQTPALGLVFPAMPQVAIWNDAIRGHLASLISSHCSPGWKLEEGDYPQEGMFWVRAPVLAQLAELGEMNVEVDICENGDDLSRAFERLLITANKQAGLSHAVAHVPGVMW